MRLGDQMYWAKDHQRNDSGSRREAGDRQQTFLSHLVVLYLATCSDIFVGNNWWIHNKSRVHLPPWYHCIVRSTTSIKSFAVNNAPRDAPFITSAQLVGF